MSDLLFKVTTCLFFVVLAIDLVAWIKLLEDKNYKLKRLFIHFKETKSGRSNLLGFGSLLKWILIFSYGLTVFYISFDEIYKYLVVLFYLITFGVILLKVYNRDFYVPRISFSNIAIFVLAFLVEILLFIFSPLDSFLWMLVINKFLLVFVIFFSLFVSVFFDFEADLVINRAIEKISKQKNLLTIAIVGSYGRGSTKEFIAKVLSSKFNVLETDTPFNNVYGIARTINSNLTTKKQIFIVEIEDERRGDIEEMMRMINPKIIVMCGINDQRVSIFGNIDKVLQSKFEAIEYMPKDGLAIFNGSNKYSREMFSKTKNKKFLYTIDNHQGNIAAGEIDESKFHISFSLSTLGKKYKIANIKLLGRQSIENLLPAIFISLYMGMDFSNIRKILQTITPLSSTMEPAKLKTGAVIIDDTHNANINSVQRAVSYLSLYKGRKVLVLEPLVELGKNANRVHEELGEQIGKTCDILYLTNNNYYKSIVRGTKKANKCHVLLDPPSKIAEYVKTHLKRDDVVVFAGRQSKNSLSLLSKQKVY